MYAGVIFLLHRRAMRLCWEVLGVLLPGHTMPESRSQQQPALQPVAAAAVHVVPGTVAWGSVVLRTQAWIRDWGVRTTVGNQSRYLWHVYVKCVLTLLPTACWSSHS